MSQIKPATGTGAPRLRLTQVTHALRALPIEQAEALALRIFGGLSITEVSQVLGRSEPAARLLVYQALHDLREQLEDRSEAGP